MEDSLADGRGQYWKYSKAVIMRTSGFKDVMEIVNDSSYGESKLFWEGEVVHAFRIWVVGFGWRSKGEIYDIRDGRNDKFERFFSVIENAIIL